MRHSFNHVVTSLVPELLGKDALLNETVGLPVIVVVAKGEK